MKVVLIPHFARLRVIVNSKGEASPDAICASYLPGMYAPWPDAHIKGFITLDVEGNTLRTLLAEIGAHYVKAKVDYEPICPDTHELKLDFDVFLNGKNYILCSKGLDSILNDGDKVEIASDTLGHC